MSNAIRKRAPEFAAVIALTIVAAIVGGYILTNQRFYPPAWVPIIGKDFYTLKAEFSTAQAVTPGQGQTVNIAGVKVGDIARVELVDGRAVVELKIERRYASVYRDATALLRPKTGLKDMIIELSPGTPTTGKLPEDSTIPVQNTLPDVNLDEVLASLDRDTRDSLKLLVNGGAEGLRGQGRELSSALRRFEPLSRVTRRLTRRLRDRRENIRRVVTNFSALSAEVGLKDRQLADLVSSSEAVFRSLAAQDSALREAVGLLPGTLDETQRALAKADSLGRELGPTLEALRPGARALGPALSSTRPFLRGSTPIIRDELRPFARAALPAVRDLRPATRDLAALTPDLVTTTRVVNYLLNEPAFNPEGDADEGYLFWLSWANHLGASVFATQDAHGPIRRGLLLASCSTLGLLQDLAATSEQLELLVNLTNLPLQSSVCPEQAGATGTSAGGEGGR